MEEMNLPQSHRATEPQRHDHRDSLSLQSLWLCGSVALWLCGKTSYISNNVSERAFHPLEVVSGVNQKSESNRGGDGQRRPVERPPEKRGPVSFDDSSQRIEAKRPAPAFGDEAERIDDRGGEHRQLEGERERVTDISVFDVER